MSTPPGESTSPIATIEAPAVFDPVALAQAVAGASSDADREGAIMTALAALGIGIYTTEGESVFRGAERSGTDFIVYDFEVTALSLGIKDGDEVYLDDVADELSVMNVSTGGAAFTPAEFATAVTSATADAMANPANTTGYALRLARELGLLQATPVDLAAPPGDEPIVLDPLAAFLVDADISLPRIDGVDPPAEELGHVASIGGVADLVAASPCANAQRQVGSNWHAGNTQLPGPSGSANASFSRSLQARLVGGTVKVSGSPPASWHHLHKGEQPAFKNNFVALQVRVPVPQRGECGPIRFSRTGQMLGGGQVVGAEVAWNYPGLDDHAQVTCSPAACQRTNAQGFAYLEVLPKVEPGPGGIGPEFAGRVTVTAEVNLFQALGPELHSVLNLPPDMRILARKQMPSDVTWHRGYKVELDIESVLRVIDNTYQLGNHVGNAKLTGMLDVATVHASGRQPSEQPIIGVLSTQTTGGQANCGPNRRGSYTAKTHNDTIDMQAIEAVIYPPEKLSLYLDVGPADDYSDETYRLILCDPRTGAVGDDYSTSGTNLWESTILYGYPRGLSLEGLGGDKWQAVATQQDWEGSSRFRVATWATGQSCGGFCTPNLSSLTISIYATPLPDP